MGIPDKKDESTSAKRSLVLTPPSSQKESKKLRGDEDEVNRAICEAAGMDHSSPESPISTSDIHECILTRVNEALRGTKVASGDGEGGLLQQIVPALVTAVSVAVTEAIDRVFRKREREEKPRQELNATVEQLKRNVLILKYQTDHNEQYSRRETVRIFGISESGRTQGGHGEGSGEEMNAREEEELEGKVLKLFKDSGANIQPQDISVLHRTGKRKGGDGRPVLVRFVSRKKKAEVMRAKMNLKDNPGYRKVFINEDLTVLRAKLLKYVKDLPMVDRAWTREGKIYARKKMPGGQERGQERGNRVKAEIVAIENPDHLFRLGVDDLDYARLGLNTLMCQ